MILNVDKSKIRSEFGNLAEFCKVKDVPYHKIHQINRKSRHNSPKNINLVSKLIKWGFAYWENEKESKNGINNN